MVVRAPASAGSPEQAEERLLVEAAQKDPARFGDLYELHFERVYAFIVRRVRDRDAAEDLTAEVFHKALSNLGNVFRDKREFAQAMDLCDARFFKSAMTSGPSC